MRELIGGKLTRCQFEYQGFARNTADRLGINKSTIYRHLQAATILEKRPELADISLPSR
jgi:transcriptional regulator of acetoin/glycerol metabolism